MNSEVFLGPSIHYQGSKWDFSSENVLNNPRRVEGGYFDAANWSGNIWNWEITTVFSELAPDSASVLPWSAPAERQVKLKWIIFLVKFSCKLWAAGLRRSVSHGTISLCDSSGQEELSSACTLSLSHPTLQSCPLDQTLLALIAHLLIITN